MKKITVSFYLFLSIIVYGQETNKLSGADKIYGLSKLWMEVNYNFVYLDKFGRDKWDSVYYASIAKVCETQNDYQYYRELQRICALLKDGHTNVYMPFDESNSNFGDYRIYPMNVEDKALIMAVNASKKDEIPIGSEIIEVNGKNTEEYIDENVSPYISTSSPHILRKLSIEWLLRGIDGQKFDIKIKTPAGKIFSLQLVHSKTKEKELFSPIAVPYWGGSLFNFKWYDNRIAYVALNSFAKPKIDTLFVEKLPELRQAKALIIDLRGNSGGSSYVGYNILKYLTNDSLISGAKAFSRKHIPVYKAWGSLFKPEDTITGNAERGVTKEEVRDYILASNDGLYFDIDSVPQKNEVAGQGIIIPTVMLIGNETASAAEDFLIALNDQKHIVTIGENTFGSSGQPLKFKLPGGGSARVCTLKLLNPDGSDFIGIGIKPNVEIKPTLKDFLNRNDVVLQRGLEYLNKQLLSNK